MKKTSKVEMSRSRGYAKWIGELKKRYRAMQIKAAVAVNSALIEFYWNLGKDISEKYPGEVYGSKFFDKLGVDLRRELPGASGFSKVNLIYCLKFHELYSGSVIVPQLVEQSKVKRNVSKMPQAVAECGYRQLADENEQQVVAQLISVPWGHHRTIIDKCKGDRDRALFYVRRTIQNGWSRNVLLNWLSADLYEREGKGQTNFALTMPSDECDLAKQLVKDPQVFEVFGLKEKHDETELKAAIVTNIERTLLSLGRLVSFVGKEYPVEIGGETKNIDLLFYIIPLHRYLVMEVKTTKYEPADLGQLSGYMVMVEQVLNTTGDNPPVGMLVCKEHNRVLAKYHLEKLDLPMGITDYELKKILPTQAQLAKCYADAEAQFIRQEKAEEKQTENETAKNTPRKSLLFCVKKTQMLQRETRHSGRSG